MAGRAEELRAEKASLVKAELDIEEGWKRLRNQQDLLLELQAGGHDTRQAERLIQLLKATLIEWERHRVLIEDRVAHLESTSDPPSPGNKA
jgi:hypothetical protein